MKQRLYRCCLFARTKRHKTLDNLTSLTASIISVQIAQSENNMSLDVDIYTILFKLYFAFGIQQKCPCKNNYVYKIILVGHDKKIYKLFTCNKTTSKQKGLLATEPSPNPSSHRPSSAFSTIRDILGFPPLDGTLW